MLFGTRNFQEQTNDRINNVNLMPRDAMAIPAKSAKVERRQSLRRRVLKGGHFYFNKGYGAFDCVVKNLSDEGALVKMEDSSGLPSVFDFVISSDVLKRQATFVWQQNGIAGVKFL